ncbi:MAG: hypothetical protein E7147_00455 [Rikenellaceae bacterium]|nr:hypothetical protein [Rikenellaceae bacterium]
MRKIFYSIAVLATMFVVSSCENDGVGNGGDDVVAVVATLENGRRWSIGDEVIINGGKYTVNEGESSTTIIGNVDAADKYCAAYDIGNGSIVGTTLNFEVASVQGPALSMAKPMVASNTKPNLVFKNLLGTLSLSVSGSGTITRVIVSSPEAPIAGNGSVEIDFSGSPVVTMGSDGARSITVDLGEGVALPASVDLNLPANIYAGLVVTIYGTDNEVMSAKSLSAVEVSRGEVATVNVEYTPDAEAPTYLTATLEADADGVAHTWLSNSVLYVNGVPAQIAGGVGTANGEFGPVSSADTYYVSTSSASANGLSGQALRTAIPTTQRYGAALSTLNPAVGKTTSNEVALSYLAGGVSVEVAGPHILRTVTLSGMNNRRLSGNGVVDLSTSTARLSLNSDASKDIVVDCGTAGVNIESGATFRFVLPADNYAEGFTLSLVDANGQTFSAELAGVAVERNKIAALEKVEWESAQGDGNNLSKLGYSNCYMVHMEGDYTFKTRKVDNTAINNIAKADWLWVSVVEGKSGNALISNVKYEDGTISFTASAEKGNALIAAFDGEGNIVWSWHIWLTDMPEVYDYQNNSIPQSGGLTDGYYCMDRNLGATSAELLGGYETFGLYYQWGRKDPFIGDKQEERKRDTEAGGWKDVVPAFGNGSQLTICNSAYSQAQWVSTATSDEIGTIEYATAHPMTFLHTGTGSKSNWRAKSTLTSDEMYDADKNLWRPFQKSNYDPCPVGYQVPRRAMWVSLVSENSVHTEYKGFVHTTDLGAKVWYPSAGYRSAHPADLGSLMSVQNDTGFVKIWSSELEVAESSYCFTFDYPMFYAGQGANWGHGYNVRCVKAY